MKQIFLRTNSGLQGFESNGQFAYFDKSSLYSNKILMISLLHLAATADTR